MQINEITSGISESIEIASGQTNNDNDAPDQPLSHDKSSQAQKTTAKKKTIWAIGGGKGGVGKSLVAANLSILLARSGQKVISVDLDLGCANLHTCLGIEIPPITLSDFFAKRTKDITDVMVPTNIKGLALISGAQDALGVANLKHSQKNLLLDSLDELDVDHLVFDLGAGTNFNTLDFFLAAENGILVLLPEPTSIENTYRFIKSAYYRRLKMAESLIEIRPMIDLSMDQKNPLGIRSPSDLVREVTKYSPDLGIKIKEEILAFKPKLIINQARTQTDIDIGFSIKSVCKKYFGIDVDYLGYLDYDSSVWQSVRRRKPVILEFPNSKLASHLERMVHYMTQKNNQKYKLKHGDVY